MTFQEIQNIGFLIPASPGMIPADSSTRPFFSFVWCKYIML